MLDNLTEMFTPGAERERQIAALHELSDHDLADLGILRDQIAAYLDGRMAPTPR